MQQIKLSSRVGDDGLLHLNLPYEFKGVDVDVILTVSIPKINDNNQDLDENVDQLEWHDFIEKTYGCLADDPITRYSQGEYTEREVLE